MTHAIADLPMTALRLRYDTRAQLESMGVRKLSDLAHLSVREVQTVIGLGAQTQARLREQLIAIGMDFDGHPQPRQAALTRAGRIAAAPSRHKVIHDFSKVTDLGLDEEVLIQVLDRLRISTVGGLRRTDPYILGASLTKPVARALLAKLREVHMDLLPLPSQIDLWHAGLLEQSDLVRPSDVDGIREWEPWLGVHAHRLADAGIANLRQLKATLSHTPLERLHGIGEYAARKIVKALRLETPACSCTPWQQNENKEAA